MTNGTDTDIGQMDCCVGEKEGFWLALYRSVGVG